MDINRFKDGDMVETAEGNIGLIMSEDGCDKALLDTSTINGGKYMVLVFRNVSH